MRGLIKLTHINVLYIFGCSPYCTDFSGEMYIEIYIYVQCGMLCFMFYAGYIFSQNEFSVETAAFMQQIWLYQYSSFNITYSHNCLFYVPQL